jgi:hypothetical protein
LLGAADSGKDGLKPRLSAWFCHLTQGRESIGIQARWHRTIQQNHDRPQQIGFLGGDPVVHHDGLGTGIDDALLEFGGNAAKFFEAGPQFDQIAGRQSGGMGILARVGEPGEARSKGEVDRTLFLATDFG